MDKNYFESLKNAIQESEQDNKPVESFGTATLTVKVDINCKLYCDGDFLDLVEANKVKKLSIPVGQHLITVESENNSEISEDHIVDAVEAGKNYLLIVNNLREQEASFANKVNVDYKELTRRGIDCYNSEDYCSAIKLFEKSAEHGDDMAQFYLGEMYYKGLGEQEDDEKAFEWYKKAAEQGNAEAQLRIGWMYFNGHGVQPDYEKTIEWYKKAAEQGNAEAQYSLGEEYLSSLGGEDYEKAAEWFKKSAEQGNVWAQHRMGMAYYKGEGVQQDYEKAAEWFKKSADQGLNYSAVQLGNMYENGEGVQQDYEKAAEWFKIVADSGNSWAEKKFKECLEKINVWKVWGK